jgi:uncharacterized protein YecE (DUF72 family)
VDAAPDLGRYEPLAKRIPPGILLGTSSWSFPGWKGIVYDREVSATVLARHGVRAYARHPLLRCVGLDRSYYAPLSTGVLQDLRAQTPPSFRFVLKTDRRLVFPGGPGSDPDIFLNPAWAAAEVVQPAREILGDKLGTLLFQFPPIPAESLGGPRRFAERLYRFLSALPEGAPATVEIRTPALLTRDYAAALQHSGARHGFVIHPEMADLDTQRAVVGLATRGSTPPPGSTLIRWMLKPGRSYQGARTAWAPFSRLASPDPKRRAAVVELARKAAEGAGPVMVVVNNKAEGSSPLSVIELARALAGDSDATL